MKLHARKTFSGVFFCFVAAETQTALGSEKTDPLRLEKCNQESLNLIGHISLPLLYLTDKRKRRHHSWRKLPANTLTSFCSLLSSKQRILMMRWEKENVKTPLQDAFYYLQRKKVKIEEKRKKVCGNECQGRRIQGFFHLAFAPFKVYQKRHPPF